MSRLADPILFIDHAPAIGGAENSLLLLMQHLQGWQPYLATVEGKLADAARTLGIPVHIVPLPRLRKSMQSPSDLWQGARAIANVARQIDALALYTNTVRAQTYGMLAARLCCKPLVWHFRDFWLGENRPKFPQADTTLKRLFIGASKTVITNSHATARHLPTSHKIHVVHNGIKLDQFDPTRTGTPFRQQFNIPLNAPLVGMMGRLRPWKGQTRFIDMAAQVVAHNSETHFVIIGGATFAVDDEYEQHLHQKTAELGLTNHIHFTGHLDNMPAALAALDIFVHPGDPEPFGLVNVEAMAMAKPIVALNHGALPEIIDNGNEGFLVSEDGMVERIVHLLNDVILQKEMGSRGRTRVVQQFGIEQTAAKIGRILTQKL